MCEQAKRLRVARQRWTGPETFRDALVATHKDDFNLSVDRQSQGRPALARDSKIESAVRYLGIDVPLVKRNKSMSEIPGRADMLCL